MRCHICDRVLNEPKYNHDAREYDPCGTCIEVIEATLSGFTSKPSMSEDEFPDPLFEELYPGSYTPDESS